MAVSVIIKPGGIALAGLIIVGLTTQAALQARRSSAPATAQAAALPKPAAPAVASFLPENQFWFSSEPKDAPALELKEDSSLPSGSGQALHVPITAPRPESWHLQAGIGVPVSKKAGETGKVTFWARTAAASTELSVAVEFNTEPYEKFVLQPLTITSEWKQYTVPVSFTKNLAVGKGNITFLLGKATSDVELSGVRFE